MLLYPAAALFSLAIFFAGIPASINEANRVHIANGRGPNAGVAFVPDLVLMVALWCIGTWLMDHFFGRYAAWIGMISVSMLLLFFGIARSWRSTCSYRRFIEEWGRGVKAPEEKIISQQAEP